MTLSEQPKKMVIVGSGAIGVEFAYFYDALGTEVTIVEYLPNIAPVEDIDISATLARSFDLASTGPRGDLKRTPNLPRAKFG